MNWRIALSILLILGGGVLTAWHGVRVFSVIYESAEGRVDLDDDELAERLMDNAQRSLRILPLLSGAGGLVVGVALAVYEAVRMRLRRR